MKKCLLVAVSILAAALPLRAQDRPEPDVIYGSDDRLDLYQVQSRQLLGWADSTVGLFEGSDVVVEGEKAQLRTRDYGEGYNLCKDEPFYDQVSGAFCSGSLVAPNVIMTAGHCIRSEQSCAGTKFVFGFSIKESGVLPRSVAASEVYGCKKLIGRDQVNDGADWALVELDRPVSGHAPLTLNRSGAIEEKTPLFVIGHPAGLPTKVAGGAWVRDAKPEGYFIANLDTYGGNSGSAVFNAKNGQVEGILVRGETDYVWREDCRVSNVCTDDACRGEDVTKISSVLPHLKDGPESLQARQSRVVPLGKAVSALLEQLANPALRFE